MGLKKRSDAKNDFINKQLAYDYQYEQKIIEQEETSVYCSRNNVFTIGKSMNEMNWHKKVISFHKASNQIKLFLLLESRARRQRLCRNLLRGPFNLAGNYSYLIFVILEVRKIWL